MDGGAWWAPVHGVAKIRARLSDFTFTFHFHALEKEMATHSSVLAWRIPAWWAAVHGEDLLEKGMATHSSILAWEIPWMQEPGGLQSMGSLGVGHD